MATHPEVLWAQRSSENLDEKVCWSFAADALFLTRPSRYKECSLCNCEPARHSTLHVGI